MTAPEAATTTISSGMLSYLGGAIYKAYYNTFYYNSAEWGTYADSSVDNSSSHLLLLLSLCGAATAVFLHSISTRSIKVDKTSSNELSSEEELKIKAKSAQNRKNSSVVSLKENEGSIDIRQRGKQQQQSQTRAIEETKVEIDSVRREEDQHNEKEQQARAEAVLAELAFLSPLPSLSLTDEDSSSFSSTTETTHTSVDDCDIVDYDIYNENVTIINNSSPVNDSVEDEDLYDAHKYSIHEQVTLYEDEAKEDEATSEVFLSEEEEEETNPLCNVANSTKEEQLRFLKARNNDVDAASKQLQKYLQWRTDVGLDDYSMTKHKGKVKGEEDDWTCATRLAFQYEEKMSRQEQERQSKSDVDITGESTVSSSSCDDTAVVPPSLPCVVFLDENKSISDDNSNSHENTNRILQHLPARIDPTSTPSTTIYALALAIYIDMKLSRTSTEKLTVLIDVRTGKGWSNTPVLKLVPFIKHAATLLNELHPERLHSCIICPIPSLFSFVYNKMVRPFLDADTAKKISIYGGSASDYSPMPKGMKECFCDETLKRLEQRRLDCFGF